MQAFSWLYPGDPPDVCFVMNREEFLEAFPRQPIRIHQGGVTKEISMQPNDVWCDLCGQDPGNSIYVIHKGRKAYCSDCAGFSIIPNKITD